MREYFIYKQRAKLVNSHIEKFIYRWLPFEYIGYVVGTKEIFTIFGSRMYRYHFHNSFDYDLGYWERKVYPFTFPSDLPPLERYLIVDDSGNVRDFYELTKQYKKKRRNRWRNQAYQSRHAHISAEKKHSITPDEIKEYKDEYGVTFLETKRLKRCYDPYWCSYRCKKVSKGWKRQSKRRKQYKESR